MSVDDVGSIYVADWRARQLYTFDSIGALVHPIGRPGEGPGEFRISPGRAMVSGDSVTVPMYGGQLLVYERTDGTFRGHHDFPKVDRHSINGVLRRDGDQFVVFAQGSHPPFGDGRNLLLRVSVNGAEASELASMPTSEPPLRGDGGSIISVPYTRGPRCATTMDKIFCGFTDSVTFVEYSLEGDSVGHIIVDHSPANITASERSAFESEYAGTEFEASLDIPATWPAYYSVVGDDVGRLWISLRSGRIDSTTTTWVVDTETLEAVHASVSGRLRIQLVSGGRVYGIYESDDGLESVVRYRIEG